MCEIEHTDWFGVLAAVYLGLYDGHGGRGAVDWVEKSLHLHLQQQIRRRRQQISGNGPREVDPEARKAEPSSAALSTAPRAVPASPIAAPHPPHESKEEKQEEGGEDAGSEEETTESGEELPGKNEETVTDKAAEEVEDDGKSEETEDADVEPSTPRHGEDPASEPRAKPREVHGISADSFADAYHALDAQLAKMHFMRSGSTAVSCLLTHPENSSGHCSDAKRLLWVANIGDSRAILGHMDPEQGSRVRAERITVDHKASWDVVSPFGSRLACPSSCVLSSWCACMRVYAGVLSPGTPASGDLRRDSPDGCRDVARER